MDMGRSKFRDFGEYDALHGTVHRHILTPNLQVICHES